MLSRKVMWLAAVAGALLLFLLTNNVGALALLAAAVVVPALSIALASWQAHGLQMSLELPAQCRVGAPAEGVLKLQSRCPVALGSLHLALVRHNRLIDAREETPLVVSPGRGQTALPFTLATECCGAIVVTADDALLLDAFGIVKSRIASPEAAVVRALPEEFALNIAVGANADNAFDADRYSMELAGGDPTETFALREYAPGDALRSIHWKLSEKTGQLIVRELGLPIANDVLVMLENVLAAPCEAVGARKANAMASVLFSVSRALVDAEVDHVLCWASEDGETPVFCEVRNDVECDAALTRFADARFVAGEAYVPTLVARALGAVPFAHVVNVTPFSQPDLGSRFGGTVLTTILFSREAETARAGATIATSARTFREDLAELEV